MADEVPNLSTNRSKKSKLKVSTILSPWSTKARASYPPQPPLPPHPRVCLRCTYLVPLLFGVNFTLGAFIFMKTYTDKRKVEAKSAMSTSTSIDATLSTTTKDVRESKA